MYFEPLDTDFNKVLRDLQDRRIEGRPKGCHLSQIVDVLRVAAGGDEYGPIQPAIVHMGFLWEDVLSEVLARQMGWRQVAADLDGIEMTLDGFEPKGKYSAVLEAKATKISSKNRIDSNKFWAWGVRTKGYCKAMGVRHAKIVVLHVNGGYELAGGKFGTPIVQGWRLEWSHTEIEENWRMILMTKRHMEEDGRATW